MRFRANLRRVGFSLMFLGLVGIVAKHLSADGTSPRAKTKPGGGVSDDALHRVREGSQLVEQLGEFRETGGRIAFYPANSTHSLLVLENLALERVSRDLELGTRKWSVTGRITEYRGANYLLVQRAVMKQRNTIEGTQPRS